MTETVLKTGATKDNEHRSARQRRLVIGIIIAVFTVITVAQWKLIGTSIASLLLTVLHFITHVRIQPSFLNAGLIDLWIASVVWCMFPFVIWRSIVRPAGTPSPVDRIIRSVTPHWKRDPAQIKKSTFGMTVLFGYVCIALCAPLIVPFDPTNQGDLVTTRLLAPLHTADARENIQTHDLDYLPDGVIASLLQDTHEYLLYRKISYSRLSSEQVPVGEAGSSYSVLFLFGTDALGRDVFSRVVYGTRISLGIGIIVAALSMVLGVVIGFISGISGGMTDKIMMRLIDIFLALPPLVLIIALFSFMGGSIVVLIGALAVSGWMGVARLVRGEVLKLRRREFILSAKLLGISSLGIIRTHMIPNIMPVIVTASVLQLVNAVMGEAALSFLGLGIQPPTASWGNMIGESISYIGSAWWIGIFPGMALSLFAIAAQLVADGIQADQQPQ